MFTALKPRGLGRVLAWSVLNSIARVLIFFAVWLAFLTVTCPAATVLYDGSLNTLPGQQGWIYLTLPLSGAVATQNATGGVTTLDTTPAASDKAGYFSKVPFGAHPKNPTLDRTSGFLVTFEVRLDTETHQSTDRSGFSVIVLSSDLKGVELGFWPNEIWVQADNPIFTHGEGVTFDTSAGLTKYELTVHGENYELTGDGVSILSGPLRNYSSSGLPYSTPNFLFFGDDSTRAAAKVEVASFSVTTDLPPPPPIPPSLLVTGMKAEGFEFAIEGETNRMYRIDASQDLKDWITLTNFVSASATLSFLDTQATNLNQRFYRIVVP